MSARVITARGNWDVGKTAQWGKGLWGNSTREKCHVGKKYEENRPGESVRGEVSLDPSKMSTFSS